jgi:hypothetical protein
MIVSEKNKQEYILKVHKEMLQRGIKQNDIPKVIAKTGFMSAMQSYPEEQMHYDVSDAVDEILQIAATN